MADDPELAGVASPPPAPPPQGDPELNSYSAALAPSAAAPSVDQPQMTGTLPEQPTPDTPSIQGHAPQQHPWFEKVYDGVMSALGGAKTISFHLDGPNGTVTQHADPATPGQQWKRIIAGALAGLGNTAGSPLGPGAGARGLALGVQGGMKNAQEQEDRARSTANNQFQQNQAAAYQNAQLAHFAQENAKSAWELSWSKTQALSGQAQHESELAQQVSQAGDGSRDLGIFPTFQDYMKAAQTEPGLHTAQAMGQLVSAPHINEKGEIDGIHVYQFAPNWLDDKTTESATVRQLVPGEKVGDPPRYETYTIPAGSISRKALYTLQSQQSALTLKALDDYQKTANSTSEAGSRASEAAARTSEANSRAALVPSEAAKNWAEAYKAQNPNATAAETREAEQQYWGPGGAKGYNQWHAAEVRPLMDTEVSYDLASQAHDAYYAARAKGEKLPAGSQSMLMLAQHIQNTFGATKGGARQTKSMIEQHLGARSVSDDAEVAVNKLINGDELSKNQWDAFGEMIGNARELKWKQLYVDAATSGRPLERIPFPQDLRQKWGLGPAYAAQPPAAQTPAAAQQPGGGAGGGAAPQLPQAALDQVTRANGQPVYFGNGQVWQTQNGQPTRIK